MKTHEQKKQELKDLIQAELYSIDEILHEERYSSFCEFNREAASRVDDYVAELEDKLEQMGGWLGPVIPGRPEVKNQYPHKVKCGCYPQEEPIQGNPNDCSDGNFDEPEELVVDDHYCGYCNNKGWLWRDEQVSWEFSAGAHGYYEGYFYGQMVTFTEEW